MNGPEHYREAERLAQRAHEGVPEGIPLKPIQRQAQIHATLALVAATIDQIGARGPGDITGDWAQVLS